MALVLLLVMVFAVLAGGGATEAPTAAGSGASATAVVSIPTVDAPSAAGGASDGGGEGPQADAAGTEDAPGLRSSGIVGDGTWTVAAPVDAGAPLATVRTYAVRVEGGLELDADATAREIAGVLTDERGWRGVDGVSFRQVADPEAADVVLSLASPPTVDRLCAPASTGGLWNCRVGRDVVLNADRWTLLTPSYADPAAYHSYMVNHEVGHFLGHGHERCGGAGTAAPVMLQQSMGLDGCRANPWPADDGKA